MSKAASSQGRLAKFFRISAEEHGDAQWYKESDAEFEVIGLGLGRTGTTSLRAAMDMLGYGPCHHGVEAYRRPELRKQITNLLRWLNEGRAKGPQRHPEAEVSKKVRTVFKGYRSTMDAPCCDLISELIAAYPDAKFILSVRDTQEQWWRSWDDAMGYHFGSGLRRIVFRALILSVYLLRTQDDMAFEGRVRLIRDWGSVGPHVYRMHNQQVRDLVPKGQLLEYNVKEGWEPLCKFLKVDVPEKPFPRLNEGESIKAIYLGMQVFGAVTWAFYFALVGAALYLGYSRLYRG